MGMLLALRVCGNKPKSWGGGFSLWMKLHGNPTSSLFSILPLTSVSPYLFLVAWRWAARCTAVTTPLSWCAGRSCCLGPCLAAEGQVDRGERGKARLSGWYIFPDKRTGAVVFYLQSEHLVFLLQCSHPPLQLFELKLTTRVCASAAHHLAFQGALDGGGFLQRQLGRNDTCRFKE